MAEYMNQEDMNQDQEVPDQQEMPAKDDGMSQMLGVMEAIAPRVMRHSGDPDNFIQQFIDSDEFDEAVNMWDGPTDMAVEYMEYMMQQFEQRMNTMPSIDSMMGDGGHVPRNPAPNRAAKGNMKPKDQSRLEE